MLATRDATVTTSKGRSAPNTSQTDLLLDIDFGSSSSSSVTQSQSQVTPNQQVISNGESRTLFNSLDIHTQPVATTATTTVTTAMSTSSSASGGAFNDLVDLFGSSNSSITGLVSQIPQTAPQHVSTASYSDM